jgi:RNA ligase (TIGR02306 family)
MSLFAVTIERIEKVWAHPDADRLDLGSVEGLAFQFCIGKGQYKVGDTVVYIPVDAVLPDALIDRLDLRNMLAGAQRNRVKTVQLRGQISQGLVVRPESVLPEEMPVPAVKTDITELLGVTKYEPPEVFIPGGKLIPLPDGLGVYDIEGADRFAQVVEMLMDKPCYITEKVEGDNTALVHLLSGETVTCQRGYIIQMEDASTHNPYEKAFVLCGFLDTLNTLTEIRENTLIALRGELLGPGIHKNIYGLTDLEVRLFDIKIREIYLNPDELEALIPPRLRVPVISKGSTLREWLAGRSIQEASNGMSLLNPNVRREGIVIKPMVEEYVDFGDGHRQRLIIKQRSPLYLAKEKG